ncbi:MAG: FkbM family methyltransferase [Gammaproteobacteria bacterium]|nr:FkbM family methyltransferase [Gammaproteobacteria bacterium]
MTIVRPDKHATLEIVDGVKICCPVGEQFMTPYILNEQQDWFEDEIKFLREIVRPDTRFIDIGANYGLYSLSVAKLCPDGHVWSYEPGGETAGYLREGIEANGLRNVTLINQALSSKAGTGRLSTSDNSELNALTDVGDPGRGEPVELTTLDLEGVRHGWREVDLVKIDAEGHELQVLEGGVGFFTGASPLVMCEIKAGANTDLTPVNFLIAHGYRSYRVIPGLRALAPQDLGAGMDKYQLNAFCCKPDRAAVLLSQNRLVAQPGASSVAAPAAAIWPEFLRGFPFGAAYVGPWRDRTATHPEEGWHEYEAALNLYAVARAPGNDVTTRYDALVACYGLLLGLVRRANLPRLLSFARVAADLGLRDSAVQSLGFILRSVQERVGELIAGEPFVPPSAEYEQVPPGQVPQNWAIASVLDAYENLRSYSSYFIEPTQTRQIINEINRLGFSTPGMERRASLIDRRLGGGL